MQNLATFTGTNEPCSFRLLLRLRPSEGRDRTGQVVPVREASVEVEINSQRFDCGAHWDLLALVASANNPGGYYLGNCACGEPGCAGIWKAIDVRHEGNSVSWTVPTPYVMAKGATHIQNSVVFEFDAKQYRAQIDSLLVDFSKAASDGGPLVHLNCYPGELPQQLLDYAAQGYPGHGGSTNLRA